MDCNQRDDVHVGARAWNRAPEAGRHPVSGLAKASQGFSPPQDQVSKDKALQSMASMSSAQIVSASVLQTKFSPPSPLPQAVFSASSRVRGSWQVGLG